ncbi:acyl-CoA hydrolase [Scopulibacillus darangshiensis]|uniref:Acyl-CoA hydrolase n=1 Tax=Scopulibacillus darangshiensis TaxID=442528 RepID=A0A4R2NGJ5_9BACL|nr:acyl-CoA thioesterase [Scopulibacillus darangshiensis]TCP20342.1 acyl-CoA hydrolase [Scopulibacillus darangshiensis]
MATKSSVSVNQSHTVQTKLVIPPDTNHIETIFGGQVLSYIDEIAAISAMRHCNNVVVTASIDRVNFVGSAKVGDILILEAFVASTGNTSMEVYVKVYSENLLKKEKKLTTTSFLTMVAVDESGNPTEVPTVMPETEEQQELFNTAQRRKAERIKGQSSSAIGAAR